MRDCRIATQSRTQMAALYGMVLAVMSLVGLPAQVVAAKQPKKSIDLNRDVGIDQRLDAQIPRDLQFRDETGRSVPLGDLIDDKPVILALVYYRCPMLCGLELNALVRALRAMQWTAGKEFRVLIVSIDPDEGPKLAAQKRKSVLQQYGRDVEGDGWRFLTGAQPEIDRLADAVGFRYVPTPDNGQFAHAAGLMIVTPTGRISKYLLGVEYVPRDLRLALVEASNDRIGTISDQLLLYCYLYDPATGRYTLSILRLLRFAGVLTVAGIGVGIVCMLRRERKKAATAADVGDSENSPEMEQNST